MCDYTGGSALFRLWGLRFDPMHSQGDSTFTTKQLPYHKTSFLKKVWLQSCEDNSNLHLSV